MIEIKNLSKTYNKENQQSVKALDDVSLQIEKGEFVAIVGPSGSGKSTLMNILGLIDTPNSGSYRLDNKEVSTLGIDELAKIRNKVIGFVFQQFHLLPRMTAKENVELPLIYSDRTNINGLAEKALEIVGLSERMNYAPEELSGGQQQRVAIARALVNNPEIILADEPTGNLDSQSGRDIMNILCDLNEQGRTIIVITHDKSIASYTKKSFKIVDGKLSSDSNPSEMEMAK